MNRSSEDASLLDEKIARIRKQNEEIIKRKQIIDEEIKQAERNNAIVNPKKSFSDEYNDAPSLHSDTISTRQNKTVVYPKMETKQTPKVIKKKTNQEDAAWRREREQIDNERIRRQKAASGWKREWDANKKFDNQYEQNRETQSDTSYRPLVRRSSGNDGDGWNSSKRDIDIKSQKKRLNGNDYDNEWGNELGITNRSQGRQLSGNDYDREIKLGKGYKSQSRKSNENDNDIWQFERNMNYKSHDQKSSDPRLLQFATDRKSAMQKNAEMRKPLRNEREGNKSTKETESKNIWRTSGPLNQKKVDNVNTENVPNVILSRIPSYSNVKVQTPTKKIWKSDFSNRDDEIPEVNLSDRLKKIVIHVKSKDNKEIERKIELIDECSTDSQQVTFDTSSLKKVSSKNCVPSKIQPSTDSIQSLTFTNSANLGSNVFTFGDENNMISNDKPTSSLIMKDPQIPSEAIETAPLVGILKKSPEPLGKEKFKKDKTKRKKTVVISEETEAKVFETKDDEFELNDENDDEWEDVSDEDWENV